MFKKLFDFTKKEWSFIFYDWAESAHTVIIGAFIFPMLFPLLVPSANSAVVGAIYGYITSGIALIIAILSPILGTYAEYKGMKKKLFSLFFVIGILFTFGLSFYPLDPSLIAITLVLYTGSMIGYAGTNIFYDSFIVDVTEENRMDKVSTAGYAFGYIGGSTIPLLLALVILVVLPASGITPEGFELDWGFRICFAVTAIWWLIFSIPLIKNVDQKFGVEKEAHPIKCTFKRLFTTFKEIKQYKIVFLFLIAYFFYIDGVHTIIAMAIPFANDVIGSNIPGFDATTALIPVLIYIQVLAFVFALIFSALSKKFKTKHLLCVTILVYSFIAIFGFFVNSMVHFWILGTLVATCQGGIQALSRSYFGRIVPEDKSNEFFGFYSIFGKVAAIVGPFLVATTTALAGGKPGDMKYGILSLIVLFLVGLGLFLYVNKLQEKKKELDK